MSDKVIRNSKIPPTWISEVFLTRENHNKNAKLCMSDRNKLSYYKCEGD